MDRRTLIFIFGMTIIFFLMNQWFYHDKNQLEPPPISQPQTEIQITSTAAPRPLTSEEKKLFNIAKLYEDIDLKGNFFYSFQEKEVFFGLSEYPELPAEAYYSPTEKDERSIGVQRLKLRIEPKDKGELFFYSVYPLAKLDVPWITTEGSLPVSAVYQDDGNFYQIKGKTTGVSKIELESAPPKNALIFLENGDRPSAYAVYNFSNNRIDYIDHVPGFEDFTSVRFQDDPETKKLYDQEKYYVLENEFIQLVFSNLNGALAEINLPFHSEDSPNSVVKEIEIDRTIQENYSFNDYFPQKEYLVSDGKGGTAKESPHFGGYYPLLRRNIIGQKADSRIIINPHYYALNVFQQEETPETHEYTLKRFEKDLIEFERVENSRKVTKTFILPENPLDRPYTFDMIIKVEGDARQLNLSLGIPEVELVSGSFIPSLKYRVVHGHKSKVEEIKTPKALTTFSHLTPDWYSNGNAFFGIIADPLNVSAPGLSVHPISGELVPSRITIIDSQFNRFPPEKYPGYAMHSRILSKPGTTKYRIFAGPYDKNILTTVDNSFIDPVEGGSPDFIEVQSYHGWFAFISKPFAKFLFSIMNLFYKMTGSWGISIILLTIVLRVMLYPLNNWSMKSTAKLQKVAPKLKEIQEKYKKDPKRVNIETMNLYKREGVNPLGGCLPILIQLPFLLGMLDLLKSSFQLRGATFIPGWINNLAAPDVLFSWSYPIPFIGTSFHLLPILLGCIMYFQQKYLSTAGTQVATEQQKQTRLMGNMMTIFFTIMFYKFPSGLNIYWMSSMLLGILQQWWVNKKVAAKGK